MKRIAEAATAAPGGRWVVAEIQAEAAADAVRDAADKLRLTLKRGAAVLALKGGGKLTFVAAVSDDLVGEKKLRADELVEQASEALEHGAQGDALGLLEEAMHYRPSDPEIQARAAQAALQSGDLQHAREFAERACELSPDTARYQLVLGRVRRRDGALAEAKQAFEAAARLDPRDPEAREEIKRLRQRPAPHTGGR
jgi:tetratricopeptide (TPR) repeat protein